MPKYISFCKKYNAILFVRYRTFLYLFKKLLYLSQDPCMDGDIKTKIKKPKTSNSSRKYAGVE